MRTTSINVCILLGTLALVGCAHHKVKAPPPPAPPVLLPVQVSSAADRLDACLHRAAFAVSDTVHASADFAPAIRDYCAAQVSDLAQTCAAQTHNPAAAQVLYVNALERATARAAGSLDQIRERDLLSR